MPAVHALTRGVAGVAFVAALSLVTTPTPGLAAEDRPTPAPAPVAGPGGGWDVAESADGAVATWTADEPLPLTSARPEITLDDRPVGPTTLSADGRSVSAAVPSGTEARDLDVVLGGVSLDDPATSAPDRRAPTTVPAVGGDFGLDPGTRGPHAVTRSDYRSGTLRQPGFRVPLGIAGHVVRPADAEGVTGRPLVLFLHGRHEVCYGGPGSDGPPWPCPAGSRPIRSDLGYDYLQELLATQGYTSVSIDANAINAQDFAADDGGAQARSALVRRHLALWAQRAVPGSRGVDLDRVVLVGHSRGGEGVDLASQQVPRDAGYRVVGQVLLAPTDFARRTAAYVPTATVLPYCDGDVSDLQGQLFTDTSRELAADDTALKSTVLVMGANHNYFNTEWTPGVATAPANDDWYDDANRTCGPKAPGRLDAGEERAVGAAYVAGAVALFTGERPDALPLFDGTPGRVPSAGRAVVYSHAVGGGRTLVLPATARAVATGGASARICAGVVGLEERQGCGARQSAERAPHWAPDMTPGVPTQSALEVRWTGAEATGGIDLARPLDLSGSATLDLRAVADPREGAAEVAVRLTDATGREVTLDPEGGGVVQALPGSADDNLAKLVAQQLRVPLDGVDAVDLTRVTRVALVARSARGRVWVLDAAGTPAALPAVPRQRLPLVAIGESVVREAPGTGRRTARVAFTLDAAPTRPARFVVVRSSGDGSQVSRTVRLGAGQRQGFVEVPYRADTVWRGDRTTALQAFPVTGVGVADGNGSLTVRDDDPRPRARLVAPRVVREGQPIRLRLVLDRPTGDFVYGEVGFRRPARGPRLAVADLPRAWVREHLYAEDPRSPLWRQQTSLFFEVSRGRRSRVVTIPTRVDRVREGRERVRVVVQVPTLHQRVTATVVVVDR